MSENTNIRHIISAADFSQSDLRDLFTLINSIKEAPHHFSSTLSNRVIATFFCEPSTRTRVSFESAIARLGGACISVADGATSSNAKGETLEDMIRTVGGYADAIVLRHPEDDSAERAACVASIPIICAGAGARHHPTQALLDLYTIVEARDRLSDLLIVVAGDLMHGRTARSLIELLAQYEGNRFTFVAPPQCTLHPDSKAVLDAHKMAYREVPTLEDALVDADVLYMTRLQKERFADKTAYERARGTYSLSSTNVDQLPQDAIIMHPLPRNEEIDSAIDADPRARYFTQAHNGLFVRMALLATLFETEANTMS